LIIEGDSMRYMMLVYTKETENPDPEEMKAVAAGHWAVMQETTKRGIFCGADPLEPTSTASTVRVDGGKVTVMDGPFAETKEQLAGYYILECENLDEALEWAARIPTSCGGGNGCIEVRPIRGAVRDMPGEGASNHERVNQL
jgi:hypothetical protein